jgi:hypothetical protein
MIAKANHPKALTGIKLENPFDIKANAVVLEVAKRDLEALLKE